MKDDGAGGSEVIRFRGFIIVHYDTNGCCSTAHGGRHKTSFSCCRVTRTNDRHRPKTKQMQHRRPKIAADEKLPPTRPVAPNHKEQVAYCLPRSNLRSSAASRLPSVARIALVGICGQYWMCRWYPCQGSECCVSRTNGSCRPWISTPIDGYSYAGVSEESLSPLTLEVRAGFHTMAKEQTTENTSQI